MSKIGQNTADELAAAGILPPDPFAFTTAVYDAGTVFPTHSPPWGELHYAISGVVEIDISGQLFLSPSQYTVWIPPNTLHKSWSRVKTRYVSAFIDLEHCATLPKLPATLSASPLLKAALADFAGRGVSVPRTASDLRIAEMVVDQIRDAPSFDSYLPLAKEAPLSDLLLALQSNPADRRSLAEWGRQFKTTERTLSRRFQIEVGLSYNEWRQRLKFVRSLEMLDDGTPIQQISSQLGYNSPSAFIAMFRRLSGVSPLKMRRQR